MTCEIVLCLLDLHLGCLDPNLELSTWPCEEVAELQQIHAAQLNCRLQALVGPNGKDTGVSDWRYQSLRVSLRLKGPEPKALYSEGDPPLMPVSMLGALVACSAGCCLTVW